MITLPDEGEAFVFSMSLVGGDLCFDFTNTLDGRNGTSAHVVEFLHEYDDLVAWGQHTGIITTTEAAGLRSTAAQQPDRAAQVFQEAIELRETLYRLFAAIAHQQPPTAADLAALNAMLAVAMTQARVRPNEDGFAWDWQAVPPETLDRILWPVARSAAELLTSDRLAWVRECPGKDCSWLFVDTSKNHTRRWCTMASCGNRAKARRHYGRLHGADA